MKRALIGGFFTILGSLWCMFILLHIQDRMVTRLAHPAWPCHHAPGGGPYGDPLLSGGRVGRSGSCDPDPGVFPEGEL